MDYVVHINDGNEEASPIVLRLLPGEETIFELRVVNHGDPSNISVDTSPPLIKAMRLKRSNHYVETEEIIPVLARMPDNVERLDGEILVSSEHSSSSVPISLISETDGSWEEGTDENDDANDDKESGEFIDKETIERRDFQNPRASSRNRRTTGDRMASEHPPSRDYVEASSWGEETPYYSSDLADQAGQETSYEGSGDADEAVEEEEASGFFGLDAAMEKIVPVIMLALIIVVLVLTFYTSTIPEFPGALISSILIVTLITYGAATLLRA